MDFINHTNSPDFFNFTSQSDLQCAWNGFSDSLMLSYHSLLALEATQNLTTSYYRYFNDSELQDVRMVYAVILGPEAEGSPLMSGGRLTITQDQPDDAYRMTAERSMCDERYSAFLGTAGSDAEMVLCDIMFAQEVTHRVDDVSCDHIGSYADGRWVSTGSVMFHEFAHWAGNTNDNIGDVGDWHGNDGDLSPPTAYGAYNAMMVNKLGRGGSANAENFMFFSLEVYYQQHCSRTTEWEDPPNPNNPVDQREVRGNLLQAH